MIKKGIHILWQFFKTWFLPLPSHDEQFPEAVDEHESATASESKVTEVTEDTEEHISTANVQAEQPESSSESDQPESGPDLEKAETVEAKPESRHPGASDFSEFVQPPEGAENRASRTVNPFARRHNPEKRYR